MNEYTKKFIEQEYEIIEFLSADEKTALVRESSTGGIYVKKIVGKGAAHIYKRLVGLQISGLPTVYKVKNDYVIMEYVNGISLNNKLSRDGVMSIQEAKSHMITLCNGVKALHAFGIIHRDITASNIIIGHHGCYLIDLGIAREKKVYKGADTHILGTVGYAAPEQFGFTQTDERTDIYALGVVFNYMLTNAFPSEKLYSGKERSIIQKCIEIDGNKRYKSVKRLKNALMNGQNIRRDVFVALSGALFTCIIIATLSYLIPLQNNSANNAAPAGAARNTPAAATVSTTPLPSSGRKLTLEKFNSITLGMRYEDVLNLIGDKPASESTMELFGTKTLTCSWWGQGSIGANAIIQFRDGAVTSKSQSGLK